MTSVPISNADLDQVVYQVARDYIEKKAINGSIESIEESTIREVVDDVTFIIDAYMSYVNELMSTARIKQFTGETN